MLPRQPIAAEKIFLDKDIFSHLLVRTSKGLRILGAALRAICCLRGFVFWDFSSSAAMESKGKENHLTRLT
jgi:hypothetical protein